MTRSQTLAEAVANVGRDWPELGYTFLDLRGNERLYRFPDLADATARRAAALQALGLRKGDRAGLIVVEPEDFVLTFLAMFRIGVVPVPLYPPLSLGNLDAYANRTAKVLTSAEAKVLIASASLQNILWSQVDKVPTVERLVRAEELATATGEPDYSNLPKPGPALTGHGEQAPPTRDCPSVQCRLQCDHGFLKDARGCDVCQCAPEPVAGPPPTTPPKQGCACRDDGDCVKVGDAGCCGCNAGGEEIAVAKACLDEVPKCEQRGAVACPQVYQCTERKAVCRRGVCVLQKP